MENTKSVIHFRIVGGGPLTLVRMVSYLGCLGKALGNHKRVSISKLSAGSLAAEISVEQRYAPHVWDRLKNPGDHAGVVRRNLRWIEEMLGEDKMRGSLDYPDLDDRIELVARVPLVRTYGPIWKQTALEGQVVKIGVGTRRMSPGAHIRVDLVDRSTRTKYHCVAPIKLIPKIRTHLLSDPIRVIGSACWRRTEKEEWEVQDLFIDDLEVLFHDGEGKSLQLLRGLAEPPRGMDPFEDYGRTHEDSDEEED